MGVGYTKSLRRTAKLSMSIVILLDTTSKLSLPCVTQTANGNSCYFFGGGHYLYAGLQALSPEQAAVLPGGVSGTVS
jgi:hypothetical protein